MVTSFNLFPAAYSHRSLEEWIRARCRNLTDAYQTLFELEFPPILEEFPCSHALLVMLDEVLERAARLSGAESLIEICAFLTHRGLEIEVSCCEDFADEEMTGAFLREKSSVHNGFTLTTYRARCPQGGTAWIIVQSHFQRLRMAA